MDVVAKEALQLLNKMRTVTCATVRNGAPAARIISLMSVDETGIYFITARGKGFYQQLEDNQNVALCGLNKQAVTVRIEGKVKRRPEKELLDKCFIEQSKMNNIYPGQTRYILEVFQVYCGVGEIFDLSTERPVRSRFSFGDAIVNPSGSLINDRCTGCGDCLAVCPVDAISSVGGYQIDGSRCLECANCVEICSYNAIDQAKGLLFNK